MEIRGFSIQDWGLKIKNVGESAIGEWGRIAIVLLVGFSSFGLGRLSALEGVKPPVSVVETPQVAKPQGMYAGGLFVASRSGSVYYYPWCSGASKIAQGNLVWFQSEQEARKNGYTSAKGCKGLQ